MHDGRRWLSALLRSALFSPSLVSTARECPEAEFRQRRSVSWGEREKFCGSQKAVLVKENVRPKWLETFIREEEFHLSDKHRLLQLLFHGRVCLSRYSDTTSLQIDFSALSWQPTQNVEVE